MESKVEELLPSHKCGLYIEHNSHKDYHISTMEKLDELFNENEIDKDEYEQMLLHDSIWKVQWYPDTPIGFYVEYSHSLESLLEKIKR